MTTAAKKGRSRGILVSIGFSLCTTDKCTGRTGELLWNLPAL